jgi:hypothetical protein
MDMLFASTVKYWAYNIEQEIELQESRLLPLPVNFIYFINASVLVAMMMERNQHYMLLLVKCALKRDCISQSPTDNN